MKPGPSVINQVMTAATFYGHVARCGCGWKAVHESKIAALVAGQRHVKAAHPSAVQDDEQKDGAA